MVGPTNYAWWYGLEFIMLAETSDKFPINQFNEVSANQNGAQALNSTRRAVRQRRCTAKIIKIIRWQLSSRVCLSKRQASLDKCFPFVANPHVPLSNTILSSFNDHLFSFRLTSTDSQWSSLIQQTKNYNLGSKFRYCQWHFTERLMNSLCFWTVRFNTIDSSICVRLKSFHLKKTRHKAQELAVRSAAVCIN